MKLWTLGLVGGLWVVAGACTSSDANQPGNTGSQNSGGSVVTTIGDQGGEAEVDGAKLVVPEGALSEDTEIGVERLSSADAEEFLDLLGAGQTAASAVYVFTPHGSQFDEPVTITLEYDSNSSSLAVMRLDDEDDRTWEAVAGTQFATGEASFETTHFSLLVVTESESAGDGGSTVTDGGNGAQHLDASFGGQPNTTEDGGRPSEQDAGSSEVTGDFEITVGNDPASVARGESGYFNVVATRADGFDGPIEVSIDGLPAGVTQDEGETTIVGQDQGTLLYFTVSAEAALGETQVTVIATGGNTTRMIDATLEVTAPAGSFLFGVVPYVLTIQRGNSAETTLTLTPQNGFEGVVNLSLQYAPEGVTLSPLMVEMSGSEPTVQTLTFSAAETTEVGTTNVNLNFSSESTEGMGTIGIGVTVE
ncbi:MAG TPA: hypothetical protein VHO25_25165 [Polyangiaceae bacterium]|nr:hypothetical protein [Polyangiaceae bacterium]